jgi:hypothetical protein
VTKAGSRKTHRHSLRGKSSKPPCPITPARHKKIITDLEGGDWPAMVALRNGIAPNTLLGWVIKGLDPEAPDGYRKFADAFVQVEADISGALVKAIMDSALGRLEPRFEGDPPPPNVGDAKWMLVKRFSFLWKERKDGTMGESAAEVVCRRIEEIESDHRDEVRKILAQLPDEAKREARTAGFLVP